MTPRTPAADVNGSPGPAGEVDRLRIVHNSICLVDNAEVCTISI